MTDSGNGGRAAPPMKTNVLVFPCGSEIGLEIHRSLAFSTHFHLVGASSVEDHGAFVYADYIGGLPLAGDERLIERLNEIIIERDIRYVLPAHDEALVQMAEAWARGDLKCEPVTSPVETCVLTRSKRATYQALAGCVPVPRIFDEVTEADLPVFLKPDRGQGSRGVHKAARLEDLRFFRQRDPGLIAVEFLPGPEFTIDCFTDRHGVLRLAAGRERRRIASGISVNSARARDPRFREFAEAINSRLELRGAWFFQVKEAESGELVLMEVAPRIGGTMGLTRCYGANLPLLSLFDRQGFDVEVAENDYDVVIDRALHNRYRIDLDYDSVYLDFDDTLLINGEINTLVIAFVFQCLNRCKRIHLITRHAGVLPETLERFKLTGLFGTVIWLQKGEEKADYITDSSPIFVDDSFAERKKVREARGVPTFDVHMLESLVDSI